MHTLPHAPTPPTLTAARPAARRLAGWALCAGLALQAAPAVLDTHGGSATGSGVWALPRAAALDPAPRSEAPDTRDCPQSLLPPAPVDTSEVPRPGSTSPAPLPIPQVRTGGPQLQNACGIIAAPGFHTPEEYTASSFIVFDIDSGDIIAAKDPHGRYRPASIIKVLLALTAIEELDPARVVRVSAESAGQEGSAVGLGAGGEYTVTDLLHGLLLASGNDAAHALAQLLGGDEATVKKVNELAQSLGTQDTRAASYSGLDAPGMSTSAFDMALIYRHAWMNPTFARIVATEKYDFPGYDDLPGYELWNDNGLLMNYPDSIGGKTGYTDDAKHTFVGAVDRGGRRLAAVVLDTTIDRGRAWEQAGRLIDAGFATRPGASVGVVEPLAVAGDAEASARRAPGVAVARDPEPAHRIPVFAWLLPVLIVVVAVPAAVVNLRHARRRRAERGSYEA
ncbi:D-alanyl-D-alanine carboxypeptidase [Corynebacterium sp. 13CS0277]|uniref:D-alanyl-D-alanine carboxypeptidase family protein n=1 Tax=Corynebacterium sp. 13CS0277 TaxID=2071994 RepID=UPI000D0233F6|nr:D-alanyl-D-alanine carboxypeptidase family protein [Corynebacterium sp. 13CS0277]PRQ11353.1 D-alanyl-D-alanine carboxypeptidase [Corynebacterium sp. 13CS0277]